MIYLCLVIQVLSKLVKVGKLVGGNPGLHLLILCLLDKFLFENENFSPNLFLILSNALFSKLSYLT